MKNISVICCNDVVYCAVSGDPSEKLAELREAHLKVKNMPIDEYNNQFFWHIVVDVCLFEN